jgi:hypothetical protein
VVSRESDTAGYLLDETLPLRFWEKVRRTGAGCWPWTGAMRPNGYGSISVMGSPKRWAAAHRVAYVMARGPIPDGLTINHLCRNKACVNPAHLDLVTIEDRFWAKVEKTDGCWVWRGTTGHRGYGRVHVPDSTRLVFAHRQSWAMAYGPIPDGTQVLHRCDNPPCVRPEHLFLGDQADNIADMVAKGRHARAAAHGESNAHAKLTDEAVRELRGLRAAGWPLKDLSARFGVGVSRVSAIALGQGWRHVR